MRNFVRVLFFGLCVCIFSVSARAYDRYTDSLALVDLYNSTNGDNWTIKTNWKTGALDTWYGVKMMGNRVHQLELPKNNLAGTFPSAFAQLTELRILNLNSNSIGDTLNISQSTSLSFLNMSFNRVEWTMKVNATDNYYRSLCCIDIVDSHYQGSFDMRAMSFIGMINLNRNNITEVLLNPSGNYYPRIQEIWYYQMDNSGMQKVNVLNKKNKTE